MRKWQWVLEIFLLFCILSFTYSLADIVPTYQLKPFVMQGLTQPIELQMAPGEPDRFYVLEQPGRVRIIEKGKLLPEPFLDIQKRVTSGGERGLLGIAFHPKYQTNKKFYVNYTAEIPKLHNIIAEFTAGSTVERDLLKIEKPFVNHNAGTLLFGKDGYLYLSTGDGGSRNDPFNNAQNKNVLPGKMLRISVDEIPYGIPKENPFAKGGGRGEIFAYGLRNIWKFSFDRATGALFAADVGQDEYEEIDIIVKGGNYGWRVKEGIHCYQPRKNCEQKGFIDPIHEYGRNDGISITGGYVYRGKKLPELSGAYIYGDYGSGRIWALYYDQKKKVVTKNVELLNTQLPLTSFGQDAQGELLVLSHQGQIFYLGR